MSFLTFAGRGLAGLLLLGAAACQPGPGAPGGRFSRSGVSFEYPAGWATNAIELVDSTASTISCEKKGLNSSGLVSISWFNDSLSLREVQQVFRKQLRESVIYKTADITFGPEQAGRYGRYPGSVCHYRFELLSQPHLGTIHTFWNNGRTFAILSQQATEDTAANRPGLRRIAASLLNHPPTSPHSLPPPATTAPTHPAQK